MPLYKKLHVILFLFPFSFFLLLGCSRKTQLEPLLVGHAASFDGARKNLGEHAKRGISLAVEEANQREDKIDGREVKVVHGDAGGDKEAVRAVVVRLLTVNQVSTLLGGPEVAEIDHLGSLAQAHAAPMLLSSGHPSRPPAEFVFFTGMTATAQGQMLARHAREMKVKKVAVLSDGHAGRVEAAEAFVKEFPSSEIAGRWTYKNGEKPKGIIEEIQAQNPDALLFAAAAGDFAELSRSGLNEKMPIFFAGEEGSLTTVQAVPATAPVYLATAFADDGRPAVQEFVKKHQERFGEAPDVWAALAYDDARLLFEAFRRAKSLDGRKIDDALRELRWDGLTGLVVFDTHRIASRPLFLVEVKNGQTRLVRRYDPPERKE